MNRINSKYKSISFSILKMLRAAVSCSLKSQKSIENFKMNTISFSRKTQIIIIKCIKIMKRINTKLKMIINKLLIMCFISCITLVLFSPALPHDLVSDLLPIILCCAAISGIILIIQYWED